VRRTRYELRYLPYSTLLGSSRSTSTCLPLLAPLVALQSHFTFLGLLYLTLVRYLTYLSLSLSLVQIQYLQTVSPVCDISSTSLLLVFLRNTCSIALITHITTRFSIQQALYHSDIDFQRRRSLRRRHIRFIDYLFHHSNSCLSEFGCIRRSPLTYRNTPRKCCLLIATSHISGTFLHMA